MNLPFRFIILLFCANIYAQENYGSDIIELKSGKVYRGEIVYESSNEVALKNMLDGLLKKGGAIDVLINIQRKFGRLLSYHFCTNIL